MDSFPDFLSAATFKKSFLIKNRRSAVVGEANEAMSRRGRSRLHLVSRQTPCGGYLNENNRSIEESNNFKSLKIIFAPGAGWRVKIKQEGRLNKASDMSRNIFQFFLPSSSSLVLLVRSLVHRSSLALRERLRFFVPLPNPFAASLFTF
jgi:hypothetical protein